MQRASESGPEQTSKQVQAKVQLEGTEGRTRLAKGTGADEGRDGREQRNGQARVQKSERDDEWTGAGERT